MNPYKILRNTISEGFSDTYNIMSGNQGYLELYNHGEKIERTSYGVADLFVIPLISKWMMDYGFPLKQGLRTDLWIRDKEKENWFRTAIGILGVVLQLPRFLIASSLTILVLPIVFLTHVLKYPVVKYLENKFYKLQGETVYTYSNPDVAVLGDYIAQVESTLNELEIAKTDNHEGIEHIKPHSKKNMEYDAFAKGSVLLTFFKPSFSEDPEQIAAIQAGKALGF